MTKEELTPTIGKAIVLINNLATYRVVVEELVPSSIREGKHLLRGTYALHGNIHPGAWEIHTIESFTWAHDVS